MNAAQNLSPDVVTSAEGENAVIQRRDSNLDDDAKPEPTLIYVGEYSGKAAYYSPADDDIILGELHAGEFTEEAYLDAPDTAGLAAHIRAFITAATEEDVDFRLSKQAFAVACADRLAQRDLLPPGQAKVYVLRDMFDISRQQTAHVLAIAPSTVDTQLREAREKIETARQLNDELSELTDFAMSVG